MADRLVALDVGFGDAFLVHWSDSGRYALIDGGLSRTLAVEMLTRRRVTRIDFLVCTHNDSDHANGVLAVLQAKYIDVQEVWLPGSWRSGLSLVADGPFAYGRDLIDDVQLWERRVEGSFEQRATSDRDAPVGQDHLKDLLEAWGFEDRTTLASGGFWPTKSFGLYFKGIAMPIQTSAQGLALLLSAFAAAENIRKIRDEAERQGVRIRWFDFQAGQDDGPAGGIKGELEPQNAREVGADTADTTRAKSLLDLLALTAANKQSLVFRAPGPRDVLFTADSDLSFESPIVWNEGLVITAPHHGSNKNGNAYRLFKRDYSFSTPPLWVRSDGKKFQRPGRDYLEQALRFCTVCRPPENSPLADWHDQDVELDLQGAVPDDRARRCTCTPKADETDDNLLTLSADYPAPPLQFDLYLQRVALYLGGDWQITEGYSRPPTPPEISSLSGSRSLKLPDCCII